jgi:glycine dehydrogenase
VSRLDPLDAFAPRHIGPRGADRDAMLAAVGAASLDALIDEAVPAAIRLRAPLSLPPAESESTYLSRLETIAARNRVCRSFIGLGYYDTLTPSVIKRCVFENPGWYTPYTPYQAEIAQGRLESLLNFQTVVTDLTGMAVANASLLDEGTAAGEAMTLLHRMQGKKLGDQAGVFLVSDRVFPQTLAVLQSRAEPLGIELRIGAAEQMSFDGAVFGALLQYPDEAGLIADLRPFIERAHAAGVLVAVATDLLALTVVTPPGEMGADIVLGNSQRFGVPMGFGGPHAAFFATREEYVRHMPGRIIGVSVDAQGHTAYRMALQTREQHIRREKATSNICTAQALLANMAAMYAVYHGPDGLRAIAERVHTFTATVARAAVALGYQLAHTHVFDTLRLSAEPAVVSRVHEAAAARGINFRRVSDHAFGISLDETVTRDDLAAIVEVLVTASGQPAPTGSEEGSDALADLPAPLRRTSAYLTHPVFNSHRSETEMMRYIRSLERKDIGLDTSMIPLGSCTMKLNAATEMYPVSWPAFSRMHPFAPAEQTAGYARSARNWKPRSVSHHRLRGGLAAAQFGRPGRVRGPDGDPRLSPRRGEGHRDVVLIPASAHGTNPASAHHARLPRRRRRVRRQRQRRPRRPAAKAAAHRDALAA